FIDLAMLLQPCEVACGCPPSNFIEQPRGIRIDNGFIRCVRRIADLDGQLDEVLAATDSCELLFCSDGHNAFSVRTNRKNVPSPARHFADGRRMPRWSLPMYHREE